MAETPNAPGPGWYIDDVTVALQAIPYIAFNQKIGFEEFTSTDWKGWSADNGIWQVGVPPATSGPGVAYDGIQCAGTALFSGAYPANVSSRLISPAITLPTIVSGQNLMLRFHQWYDWDAAATAGFGQVLVSTFNTSNGSWSAWTALSGQFSGSSGEWVYVGDFSAISLNAFAGETIRLAFQQNGGTNPASGWYIDDIVISLPTPMITSFTPTQGEEGTAVTITGNLFDSAAEVTFTGAAATFAIVSRTEITTTVPAGATTGPITVTTAGGTATSTQIFTVPPTATPQTVAVDLGAPTPITLTGTDHDSPPIALKFKIASQPANGALSGFNDSTGAITYTPNEGFKGTDSFTFTVNNGTITSTAAKVTLNVAAGTPTANPQTVTVARNSATAITLTGMDGDDPSLPLTFAIKTAPGHGTLGTLNTTTGKVTYTPAKNFGGVDSFTFTVNNGVKTSPPATVTLNVTPGTPTANAQTVAVKHAASANITLTGSDPDSPALPLTFAIAASPAHGALGGLNNAGTVTYTPNANFHGADSFTFTVSNGTNTSAAAKVTLNVAPGTPTANAQTVTVAHNITKTITLTGSDSDVPTLKLTFAIGAKPTHGTLGTLNAATGGVTYTPSANFQGTDSFTFTVSNGTNTSAAAKVTLNVAPGTPTANAQTVAVAHNITKTITLTGTDPDLPTVKLTFAIAAKPTHGTLGTLNAATGVVTYTPSANFQGTDSFTFTVSNGTSTSAAAKVTLNVAPGIPTANAQTVAVAHNTAKTITLTGTDPDLPTVKLTFAIVAKPAHGTLGTLNAATGGVIYTPSANFHGADSFTFTVSNGTST